jgi:hypothetical protein
VLFQSDCLVWFSSELKTMSDLVAGIGIKAGCSRGITLPGAYVFEIEEIAIWSGGKDYAVVAANKTVEALPTVPDLVPGIWRPSLT